MATVDDFGGAADSLGSVPFGGPTGWAAAVRDHLRGTVVQAGSGVSTTEGLASVTFPEPFASAPRSVVVTPLAGPTNVLAVVRSVSSTGFVFSIVTPDDVYYGGVTAYYVAVGTGV